MPDLRRYWPGYDRVTVAGNQPANRAFDLVNGYLRSRFGRNAKFQDGVPSWGDLAALGLVAYQGDVQRYETTLTSDLKSVPVRNALSTRQNVVDSGGETAGPGSYLFHSLVGVPQPNPVAGMYDAGARIVSTNKVLDFATDASLQRAVWSARVRPLTVEQTGTVASSREVYWLMAGQPFIAARVDMPAAAGSTSVANGSHRMHILIRCWCSEQADGVNPTDLRVTSYEWELLRTI